MAIANAMCTSFKKELFTGTHIFKVSGGHAFKFALIKASETFTGYNANVTAVGTPGTGTASASNLGTDEVTNGSGYATGGFALTVGTGDAVADTSNGVAYVWFTTNPNWTTASFSANGGIIYNSSVTGNNAVAVFNFGGTQTVSSGTFTVVLPANNSTSSILRIA